MVEINTMDMEDTLFLNEIENLFMPEKNIPAYSITERQIVLDHIEKNFGKNAMMISDKDAHLMRIDMSIIPPTAEKKFYTVTTVGMGAMLMNVPRHIADGSFSRAELMITLPHDWKISSNARKWHWPMTFLENISRIPLIENSWFSVGHIIPIRRNIAENTALSGFLLLEPQEAPPESHNCRLPDGSRVHFYQLIPLYEEEIEYERRFGFDALIDRMADVSHIVDVSRLNSCGEIASIMQ